MNPVDSRVNMSRLCQAHGFPTLPDINCEHDWNSMTTFSFDSGAVNPKTSSPRESVEWAVENGFGGVEINAPAIRLANLTPEDREFLVAMRDKHGLRYTYHFPSSASPGSHDEAGRERDRMELVTELEVAGEVGVEVIVLHPGRLDLPGVEQVDVPEEKRIEALTFLVDFMKSSAPTAEKSGVVVGLENMHYNPGWLIRSHQELVHAVDAIDSPAVGITFDSGHAWGSGGIDNGIAAFGDRIRHVQVHDARGLEGAGDVRDQHLEIGTGILDFTSIGELVKTKPFVVTFETATRGDDPIGAVLRSRERLLELWG